MKILHLVLLLTAVGCSGGANEPPTIAVLSPSDGAAVAAGDVEVSLLVENFELITPGVALRRPRFDPTAWLPIATAEAHGDEAQRGWIALVLDEEAPVTSGDTQAMLVGVAAGAHVLTATLIHEDGEPADASPASVAFTAE
jgi:hypothetical protein